MWQKQASMVFTIWSELFREVNLINKLRFGLFLLKMTSCELALGCVLKCVGSLGLHEAHRIQHSADLIEEMCCIIADLLFLSLSLSIDMPSR